MYGRGKETVAEQRKMKKVAKTLTAAR